MSPVEAAIRAVCTAMGADPDTWRGFEEIGRVGVEAFINTLPPDLAEAVRSILSEGTAS